MNTGENDRELSDDELNQVTGGGPGDKQYLGPPMSIPGSTPPGYDTVHNLPVPNFTQLFYPFPLQK